MTQGKRVWTNLHTKDLSEAVKKAAEVANDPLSKPTDIARNDVERFVQYKQRMSEYSRNSAITKKQALLKLLKEFPDHSTTATISTAQIESFYRKLQSNVSESTAQGYIMTLRSFFQWAVNVERTRIDNPVLAVKLARCDKAARTEWCAKHLKDKLIKEATSDELRFILYCGFDAGLRRNEISEARRDWFDLNAGLLHVRKAEKAPRLREGELPFLIKDRDERTIPLTDAFKNFLKSYLEGLEPLDFVLYPDIKHDQWRYRYDFRRPFTDYMKQQGAAWVTPHVMRHTFASILASAGIFHIQDFRVARHLGRVTSKDLSRVEWLGDRVDVVQRHYAKLASSDRDIEALS